MAFNFSKGILNKNTIVTPEGGTAQIYINKTGAASIKGSWVHADSAVAGAVNLVAQDKPDPIGVIYNAGVPDGSEVFVVTAGIGEALFSNAPTMGYLARGYVAADTAVFVAGSFISEPLPASPFTDAKHFYEGGHILETKTAAGTAKVNLHFN